MEKLCSACGETKPVTEFWRKRSGRGGFQAMCKACADIAHRAGLLRPPRYPAPEGTKRCSTCKAIKPVEDFTKNARYFDGYHIACKACHYARHRAYREIPENNAKILAGQLRRTHQPATKEAYYNQRMRKKYGLPAEWTYAAMLAHQGGGCSICGRADNPGMFRFAIDHNAVTGEVRGLLCTCCNQAIGQLQDSPELLRRAISYLENPPARQLNLLKCGD